MNLQYERMQFLCETLNLPFVAQGYASAAQTAAEQGTAYSDFLESLLKTEAAGRQVRKQSMLTRLAGFPAITACEVLRPTRPKVPVSTVWVVTVCATAETARDRMRMRCFMGRLFGC